MYILNTMTHKDRHTHQWNSTESTDIKPYICSQLTLSEVPSPLNEEKIVFQIILGLLQFHIQRKEYTIYKSKFKLNKLSKYELKSQTSSTKNTGVNLHDFGLPQSWQWILGYDTKV